LSWRLKNPRFDYQLSTYDDEFLIYNNFYNFFKIEMGRFSKSKFLDKFKNHKNKLNLRLFNLWIGLGNYDGKIHFILIFQRN
jgi:hypothetical protein